MNMGSFTLMVFKQCKVQKIYVTNYNGVEIMKSFKWVWYIILTIAFLLVTFFGLGPVLFADGGSGERVFTLIVVIILYIIIGTVFVRIKNQGR